MILANENNILKTKTKVLEDRIQNKGLNNRSYIKEVNSIAFKDKEIVIDAVKSLSNALDINISYSMKDICYQF